MTFQIVADHTAIRWQIMDLGGRDPNLIESAIRASYPEAEIQVKELDASFDGQPFFRSVMVYGQINPFFAPILQVTDIRDHDPLAFLTQAMNELRAGERIVYSLLIVGFAQGAYKEGERLITQSAIHPLQMLSSEGIGEAVGRKLAGNDRRDRFVPEEQRIFEDKLNARLYQAMLFIQLDTPWRERLQALALCDTHLNGFLGREKYNWLTIIPDPEGIHGVSVASRSQDVETGVLARFSTIGLGKEMVSEGNKQLPLRQATRLIFDPREIASLWHLPHQDFRASRIAWVSAHRVNLPESLAGQREGICLGDGYYLGQREPVFLKTADRRGHMSIVGKTGVGKSTLLLHCVHQDIARGNGVAVIDPHGTLVCDILRWCIPEGRKREVVLLDLADTEHPMPLNPLRTLDAAQSGAFLGILDRLYGFQHTRMRDTMAQALLTASLEPHPSVRDVVRVLEDDRYRASLVSQVRNPATLDFWADFARQSASARSQLTYPVVSRLRSFYGNEVLYPVMCHPHTLDFRELMQHNRIILVSLGLAEDRVPEAEQRLLGSLVVSALQMAAMHTAAQRQAEPFFLYIDEVQYFITTSLEKMLSEARKYGLSLTIANQFLAQLAGETLEAVLGNIATMIAFATGPDDAPALAKYMQPTFEASALLELDKYQAAVKMQCNGKTQPAFTLFTHGPLERTDLIVAAEAHAAEIRELSRKQYTPLSRAEVLGWLEANAPKPKRKTGTARSALSDDEAYYDKGDRR